MPTIYHSSKDFLKDLAKGPIYLNSQPHTKITTIAVEVNLNTITQYTSLVLFKKKIRLHQQQIPPKIYLRRQYK